MFELPIILILLTMIAVTLVLTSSRKDEKYTYLDKIFRSPNSLRASEILDPSLLPSPSVNVGGVPMYDSRRVALDGMRRAGMLIPEQRPDPRFKGPSAFKNQLNLIQDSLELDTTTQSERKKLGAALTINDNLPYWSNLPSDTFDNKLWYARRISKTPGDIQPGLTNKPTNYKKNPYF
jgi:hypothetical protein